MAKDQAINMKTYNTVQHL